MAFNPDSCLGLDEIIGLLGGVGMGIAAIYGIEESRSGESLDPPARALVMELVEGEDLS